jgi:uridine kinase
VTRRRSVVVGVAGGSGSGKTTVVRRIVDAIGAASTVVLRHDSYYRDLSHMAPAARVGINYDHPDALESDLLVAHLAALLEGEPVEMPVYDFAAHVRLAERVLVAPQPLIIVDGLLVLGDPRLRALMDLAVFVDTDPEARLARRLRRDVRERGRSEDSVLAQFRLTVQPMHELFVQPTIRYADIVVRGGGHNRPDVERVVTAVRQTLASVAEPR